MRLDLAHDVASMDLDGVFAHAELVGDDLIGFTLAQSVEDLDSQAGNKGKSRFAVVFGIAGWRRKRGCSSQAPGTNPASRDSLAPDTPGQGQRGMSNFRRSAQTQRKKALRPRQTSGRPGGLFWGASLQARHLGNVAWAGCGRAGSEDLPPIAHSRPQEFNCSGQFLFHAIALCQTSSSLVCLPEEVEMVLILIGGFGTHII